MHKSSRLKKLFFLACAQVIQESFVSLLQSKLWLYYFLLLRGSQADWEEEQSDYFCCLVASSHFFCA